jgi:hypothetical protein
MSGAMPFARTLLTMLVFALCAAPAQAWRPPSPGPTGGALPSDASVSGGAIAADPLQWPGDDGTSQPPAGGGLLDGLLDGLLPNLDNATDPALAPVTTTMVSGTVARLRTDGRAAIPRGVPKRVRRLIAQYNKIVGKRYRWGGGHALVDDKAYDCSGAVGYGLIKTGMLDMTMVSGSFARWAAAGEGRWMTIYANRSHVYTEIAGLRLDTSPVGDPAAASGVRWRPAIGGRNGFKVRHPVGF